ncbi:MAG TPA: cytidylate kinase family protein [Candidatus Binatia bacterium]
MAIITISHEAFGHGRAVAERVAEMLGYRCISREVLLKASERYGIAEAKLHEALEEKPHRWWTQLLESRGVYRIALQAAFCELAQEGNIVYHGRGGHEFLPGIRHVLNVFIDTPRPFRIEAVKARKGLTEEAANKYLDDLDRIRAKRLKELFRIDWRDPTRYDFVLNTARMSVETAARFIADVAQREEYQSTPESLQAIKDLTITARVEALLMTSRDVQISGLEVQTNRGRVFICGTVVAAGLETIVNNMIRTIPGVTEIEIYFVVAPLEQHTYADGR